MATTRADVEKVLDLISRFDVETLKSEDFDIFQYQGFDPLQIATQLFKVKRDAKIPEDQFIKDITTMVAIGMIKGSVNTHNLNKMSEEGKEGIMALNTKYGIQLGGGRGQGSKVITYPRVMATFPDLAVRLVSVLGPKEFRGGPMLSTRLPKFLQVQVFPSIIPRSLDETTKIFLLTASLCYSIDQTAQISRIDKPDVKQLAVVQGNYIRVGHTSPVPSPATRGSVFRSLPFAENYNNIKLVVEDYRRLIDDSIKIPSLQDLLEAIERC